MSRPARRTILVFVWCLVFLVVPGIAEAHAKVVATSPVAYATLASSPSEISVTFNEPVTIESLHPLVIMRTDGTPVTCSGGVHQDPSNRARLFCTPASPLRRGAYTAFWLVTSADTHVVHGSFAFGIGVAVREALGASEYPYDPSGPLASVLRWLSLLGAALIVGTLTFEASVLRARGFPEDLHPALASLSGTCTSLRRVGICVTAVAGILALDVQAAAATGSDALSAIPSLPQVIVDSTWGLAWLARMCALIGIGLLTWRGRPSPVSLGLCALFILSFGQSGHAVVSSTLLAADWIHMTCASLWFGGLATFAMGLRPALTTIAQPLRSAFAKTLILRFSAVALPAVTALIVTGVYASLDHYVTPLSLTKSLYGTLILAKIVLLLPLLALGYYHFRSGRGAVTRTFAVTVACEAVLVVVVFGLSAVLTGVAPPPPPGSDHG